ncbi:DNA pilot protein [Apis mellifera associated microvirus 59]|nr:DNA pilot protein [Apis mellifera associated microvirus 59]
MLIDTDILQGSYQLKIVPRETFSIKQKVHQMPVPLIPVAAAAATLGSGIFSGLSNRSANKDTLAFQEDLYNKQRRDALADRDFENDYNSPQNQMARLKSAGLNPNLVYGNGSAVNTSAAVRPSSGGSYQARPVNFAGAAADTLLTYTDMKMKDAQLSNLEEQNNVLKQEAMLKAMKVVETDSSARLKGLQADTAGQKLNYIDEIQKASIENIRSSTDRNVASTKLALSQQEINAANSAQSIRESAERILSMREQRANTIQERDAIRERINNLRTDNTLKQLHVEMRKQGIEPGDAIWVRLVAALVGGETGNDLSKMLGLDHKASPADLSNPKTQLDGVIRRKH